MILKTIATTAIAVISAVLVSCGSSVEMPKGTAKGYNSARLVKRDPRRPVPTQSIEVAVNSMIQKSLDRQFTAKGISYGSPSAQLTVAYMVIFQEPGMTARYDDWFGYGRDGDPLSDRAHARGVLESKRADYFQRAGIVIDVIESSTGKLLYRNYATGDVVSGTPSASRIDAAVASALSGFFR